MPYHYLIQTDNTLKFEKKTDLYSFDSSFTEVSLHLNVDLYISNIAEDTRCMNVTNKPAF